METTSQGLGFGGLGQRYCSRGLKFFNVNFEIPFTYWKYTRKLGPLCWKSFGLLWIGEMK